MVSKYIKHLKGKRIFSKKRSRWESLGERTINAHIKKLSHALEIVDSRGTQACATQEQKKKVLFTHLEKVSALPKEEEK